MGETEPKRTYLVIVDDSEEARVALRFAARRAAKTNGRIEVLGIAEPQDFVQFGGAQAAVEEEQRPRCGGGRRAVEEEQRRGSEGIVSAAVGEILDESGIEPKIIVQHGEPVRAVR